MAKQVSVEELQGCKTYLGWLYSGLDGFDGDISLELCKLLFDMDFTWSVEDDGIRATDALELRKIYAEDVGKAAGKSERDIDRIRKSVHGKASVLEVIFSLCRHLDGMVNENEPGTMIGYFYRILIHNLVLDEFGDENFSPIVTQAPDLKEAALLSKKIDEIYKKRGISNPEEVRRREHEIKEIWSGRVKKWLDRDYFESGEEGGMFPLHEWKPGDKDQKKVSLWYQMNAWLNEHLDDEERFIA